MELGTMCMSLIISCLVMIPVNGNTSIKTNAYDMDKEKGHMQRLVDRKYADRTLPMGQKEYDTFCERKTTTLTCKTIPKKIPAGVTNVIVTFQDQSIPENQFQDHSWTRVDTLHIQGENFSLKKGNLFEGLINLTTLYLNGTDIDQYNGSCFAGLDNLKNLTLAGMDELDGSSLQLAMSNKNVLPKLKYFALNPGETFRSPFMKVQYRFLKSFTDKRLQCLNLSNTICEIKAVDLLKFIVLRQGVNVVNLTGSFVIIDGSPIETYVDNLYILLSKSLFNTLDTSSLRATTVKTDFTSAMCSGACTGVKLRRHYIDPIFLYAETWYHNYIYLARTNFQGIYNLSLNRVFLKKLVFTGNNIANMNATCIFPHNNTLLHLDLSKNRMEYIGTGVFITTFALQKLSLSNNQLFHMEHLPEFEGLLKTLKNLRIFDLSSNSISFLPKKMFVSNTLLESLILANNRLSSISFDFGHLKKLRELDLRGNMIKFLDKNELYKVQMFINGRQGQLDIRFQGNPIECLCKTRSFISWLATLRHISKETMECSYEDDTIDINEEAVGKCNYLCKRATIIAASTTCSIVAVVAFILTFMKIKRMRERKKRKNVELVLKDNIQAGNFICFAAMSGNDEDLVHRVILKTLRRYLQGKVNLDNDVVCTGNRFKPGFSICEESYRLLKMSHVFIAVVSDEFLRSQYCRMELQEACKQDKPMILIFLGRVDIEDMPQYMQEVFRRNSRAWIKQNDEGYYYIVPSLMEIGDAIWDLAILHLLHKG